MIGISDIPSLADTHVPIRVDLNVNMTSNVHRRIFQRQAYLCRRRIYG